MSVKQRRHVGAIFCCCRRWSWVCFSTTHADASQRAVSRPRTSVYLHVYLSVVNNYV